MQCSLKRRFIRSTGSKEDSVFKVVPVGKTYVSSSKAFHNLITFLCNLDYLITVTHKEALFPIEFNNFWGSRESFWRY